VKNEFHASFNTNYMNILHSNLVTFTKLKLDELEPILGFFQITKFAARAILLEKGSVCQSAWFIDSGILRAFYHLEESKRSVENNNENITREITNWILPEGGFLTDVRSFLHQTPSSYYIETLEQCTLYKISYDNYVIIQRLFPDIARVLFEHTTIMADLSIQVTNFRHPEDRLRMFEMIYPTLTGRLSINVQASYLNIDPTTLSRIRGKIKRKT
jgi:CRP-like cAMP-binding protein